MRLVLRGIALLALAGQALPAAAQDTALQATPGKQLIDQARTLTSDKIPAGDEAATAPSSKPDLVLAPIPLSFRPADAPARQARALRPNARTLVIAPDGATRRVIGYKFLDMTRTGAAMEAGHAQAQREAERIARTWQG